jgi:hypothetical protein
MVSARILEEHAAFFSQVNTQEGGNVLLQNDGKCLKKTTGCDIT